MGLWVHACQGQSLPHWCPNCCYQHYVVTLVLPTSFLPMSISLGLCPHHHHWWLWPPSLGLRAHHSCWGKELYPCLLGHPCHCYHCFFLLAGGWLWGCSPHSCAPLLSPSFGSLFFWLASLLFLVPLLCHMVVSQEEVTLKHHSCWLVQDDKLELQQFCPPPPDCMVHMVF